MNKNLALVSKVTNDYNLALKYESLEAINQDKDQCGTSLGDVPSNNPLDWKSYANEDHYFVMLYHKLSKLHKYTWIKKLHPKAFNIGNATGVLSKDLNQLRKRLIYNLLWFSYAQIQKKTLDDIHQIKYVHRKAFEKYEEINDTKANSLINNNLRNDITILGNVYGDIPKIKHVYHLLDRDGYNLQNILELQGLITVLND